MSKKYQHYKTGQLYEIIDFARHSETYEELVVYRALYQCDQFGDYQLWVRPKKMFFENVDDNGQYVPRFKVVNDEI